ncbi:16S rRNA (uracil(1498)-N(3))-methyltransferase [Nitratidesulfovibrio vulgaris]|uniref:16S rRNA (uracil(1498)-N(3))-methyltransferase n=1 Tax=Nitratidesulfovibrio vulgaris TaxID=881 RepID=UPI002300AB12|nr:16S rRNA (uracil(1498)-N(3))-methyltransferase [Nitratidesulfovibrio vulgaris]WCB45310.1 16S rRNA (uracil(1498)-N(3))-methyltransferase [Nitratidesulfovibrio vulgaris]
MRTFFLPSEQWSPPYALTGQEARHLTKVVRVHAGDLIRLLDGAGREGVFRVTGTSRNSVELTPESITTHPEPVSRAVLAVGWGKAVRRSWLMEKAVELEASAIWLWQADHSQSPVPDDIKESWLAQMVAGAKQSANPWLPALRTLPGGIEELLRASADFERRFMLWEGETPEALLEAKDVGGVGTTLYVVGPEGGFSAREVKALREGGMMPVSLGQRVLRWETAALLCLGLHWWGRQKPTAGATVEEHP